jgi:hypothetical protein
MGSGCIQGVWLTRQGCTREVPHTLFHSTLFAASGSAIPKSNSAQFITAATINRFVIQGSEKNRRMTRPTVPENEGAESNATNEVSAGLPRGHSAF